MASRPTSPITQLLAAAGDGDAAARERLWVVVYDELHRIAQGQLARDAPGGTLQPTALVNEAYLRLVGDADAGWSHRRHFFSAAAKAMRRIRIDYARKRQSLKRGGAGIATKPGSHGGTKPRSREGTEGRDAGSRTDTTEGVRPGGLKPAALPVEEAPAFDQDPAEVLAVDEALTRLERIDARQAEVVLLRYFAGLSVEETAQTLGVSPRTVESDWRFAKAWLHQELA